jgi:hypothetical protein
VSKGQHQWYENIYDISSPQDWVQQESLSQQPQQVKETGPSKAVFTHPELFDYNNEDGDYSSSSKFKHLYQEADPENQPQMPDLSIDKATPNEPPRKNRFEGKSGYLADQTSGTPANAGDAPDESSDLELANGKAYPEHVQPTTIPDPTIEIIAKSIVAEYNLEHSPIELDLSKTYKVSWTLEELVQATSSFSVKNEPRCQATFKRVQAKFNRYAIHVVCGESWSDPTGHVVKLKFEKTKNVKQAPSSNILVACDCPFWRFYGCDWNAGNKDYLNDVDSPLSNGAAPTVRGKQHLICKHIAASLPLIKYLIVRKKS